MDHRPHIVVVEDEARIAADIAATLRASGMAVDVVSDGEAAWFSASASLPGISMSAKRAATQIIRAIETGRAERILSTPANRIARFHGLFPELSISVLGLVNRLLPHGSQQQRELGKDSVIMRRPWMRALTILGRRAAEEYLQPAGPAI